MVKQRVGIIGTGFGAKVHGPMFRHHKDFEVAAIASVARGNVDEAKRASGVETVYTDWRDLLKKEKLDLIVVASAPFLHKEMAIEAYKKGIHVLCEKPMALNKREAEEMMIERDRAEKFGLINHEFRFLPTRKKVKEIIEEGALGDLIHIRYEGVFPAYSSLTSRKWGWLGQRKTGGGMLGAIGSHMIDSLHWWTESTFSEVMANLITHIPEFKDDQGEVEYRTADDGFQVMGKLENEATVTLELVSAVRKAEHAYRLEIFGSKGTLLMLDDKEVLLSKEDAPFEKIALEPELKAPDQMPAIAARYYNGFYRMLNALSESLQSGRIHPDLSGFEDGLATQRVLDAIRQSADEERKIRLQS